MVNKACQCGMDYEYLKTWADLANKQVTTLKAFSFLAEPRGLTELFSKSGDQFQDSIAKHKELFMTSTERIRRYQKNVEKSCGITLFNANKSILNAEKDVRKNDFNQAEIELSQAELMTVSSLSDCTRRS